MSNGWTPERKRRQSELIHRWKQWEQSTGPKTPEGKARTRLNALKQGVRSAEMAAIEKLLGSLARERRNV